MKYQKDYYQILGIKPNTTAAEIKSAYHRMVKENHPDRNASTQATAKMQEINEAYSVLGVIAKRIQYDSEYYPSYHSQATSQTYQTKTSSYAETANLQEFFAKENAGLIPDSLYIPLIAGASLAIIFSCMLIPIIPLSVKGIFIWAIFFIISAACLSISVVLFFQNISQADEKENQCPKCGKTWAAEKLDEKLLGIFQKLGSLGRAGSSASYNRRGKYQIHYKCKHCAYQWLFIKTKDI